MTKPVLLLVFLTGCSAQLKYVERWPLQQQALAGNVRVDVTDERPMDEGGDNPRQVGVTRGGYGNPFAFENDDPQQLTRLIRLATVDALRGAGIEAAEVAPFTLRARLTRFWMDGYMGYWAEAEVQYELVSSAGAVVWSQRARARETGAIFAQAAASDLLNDTLAHLAKDANAQFRRNELQKAISGQPGL